MFQKFIFIAGILIGLVGMEILGWFIHKFLMHGPLWFIHRTHHRPSAKGPEWNDVFSLIFGSMGLSLMWWGLHHHTLILGCGIGICLYGGLYFVMHDGWVHRRWKVPVRWRLPYIEAMIRAHRAHHASLTAKPSESFGLLWFPTKFLIKKTP
jgi:beta-carotene 3-hydroxylase